jgi:hypothetical protein
VSAGKDFIAGRRQPTSAQDGTLVFTAGVAGAGERWEEMNH